MVCFQNWMIKASDKICTNICKINKFADRKILFKVLLMKYVLTTNFWQKENINSNTKFILSKSITQKFDFKI